MIEYDVSDGVCVLRLNAPPLNAFTFKLLNELHSLIDQANSDDAVRGIVITGGTSLLNDVCEMAESIFNLPTRLGKPRGIAGLVDVVNNPMYATGVGLVLYGARNQTIKKFRIRDRNIFNRVTSRMKKWFEEIV